MNSWEVFLLPTSLSSEVSVKMSRFGLAGHFLFHQTMSSSFHGNRRQQRVRENPSFRKPSALSMPTGHRAPALKLLRRHKAIALFADRQTLATARRQTLISVIRDPINIIRDYFLRRTRQDRRNS